MKKFYAVIAALAFAISTAFITAAPAQASVPAAASDDRLFVKLVTKEAPELRGISTKTMVKTAKSTCKFLRSGFTVLDAVELMEDNGFSEKASIAFVAGSIVFYCPDQENNY